MVDLARQQRLALLGLLAVGDVHRHAADPHHAAGRIEAWRRGAEAPAHLAVRTLDAEFILRGLPLLEQLFDGKLQAVPVVRMNERADVLGRDREALPVDAEDRSEEHTSELQS